VFLPTVIEAWCTCRFWPCRNAAKPQQLCQTVAFGSQHHTECNIYYDFFIFSIITLRYICIGWVTILWSFVLLFYFYVAFHNANIPVFIITHP
jgi:predicted transglutaminase-like protease